MEIFEIDGLTFRYPGQEQDALSGLSFGVERGSFVTLCGPSGCGKTTLLRNLKPALTPHGERSGSIGFAGRPLESWSARDQAAKIGFVQQSPDNQIVTDKVWHELAFGLESLGYETPEIRGRVAEMASFFGIQNWFSKDVAELSGGQKQLLNLASVMVMNPEVLILDEPTGQLDPVATTDFLNTLARISRELGTTVIITEQRLEEVLPLSDRVIFMDRGRIVADGTPSEVGEMLRASGHKMFAAMPTPMRVWAAVPNELTCPVTVREGREWLEEYARDGGLTQEKAGQPGVTGGRVRRGDSETESCAWNEPGMTGARKGLMPGETVAELTDLWFRFGRDLPDVVKGVSLTLTRGELLALLGGNGTGKSTLLSLLAGVKKPYRGRIRLSGSVVMLPQNPQALFVKKTVGEDLRYMFKGRSVPAAQQEAEINRVVRLCRLEGLTERHPYDLSGGEQQRAALAKVLLTNPEILLLDEPTKGMDAEFKLIFGKILRNLQRRGVTILMVSHDADFCAEHADRCALFFDGNIITEGTPGSFFSGNSFYTTAASRMSRNILPEAVTASDVIRACGGTVPPEGELPEDNNGKPGDEPDGPGASQPESGEPGSGKTEPDGPGMSQLNSGRPNKKSSATDSGTLATLIQNTREERKLSKRTLAAAYMILLMIPVTLFVGDQYLDNRNYYIISTLILLEVMLPFALVFEGRKPRARELVVVAVLCAIAVAGRMAFYMLPNFKPVMALVIISGVALGGETGFLVGAVTMLLSNMMFGQGPWTPWQMFAMGIIGFLAGVLFRKGLLPRGRLPLGIFGMFCAVVIYGGIMNPASALMWNRDTDLNIILSYYATGLPMDLVHGAATFIFLWLASGPMLEKLEHIKEKYGLVESR